MLEAAIFAGNKNSRRANTLRISGFVLCAALVATGCTRGSNLNQGGVLPSNQQTAAPLPPSPTQPVQNQGLKPIEEPTTDVALADPNVVESPKPAENPGANAQPVTRQAMIGAWTVSTGGSNCQIFLALTKWSGGYRAASRGCSAAAISDVQAWDVKGKQVVLVDSSGSQAATLYRSGDTRFDGSTKGGGAISFTR
ncbi:MAG: protease inhibitor Inh/omp19 family protein [Rhizobiaceae bacterium]